MADAVKVPEATDVQGIPNGADHHGNLGPEEVQDGASDPAKETEQAIEHGIGGGRHGLGGRTPTTSAEACQRQVDAGQAEQNPTWLSAGVMSHVASLDG